MDNEQDKHQPADRFEGARWFAGLVNAYAGHLDFQHVPEEAMPGLLANFQDRLLEAILDPNIDDFGILAIINPEEYQQRLRRQDEEHQTKMAERAAKLLKGA